MGHPAKWEEAEEAYRALKECDPVCAERMATVSHADDKKYPPLQMADLMASIARQETLGWRAGISEHRPEFKRLADNHSIYYIGYVDRRGMLNEMARNGISG